MSVAPRRDHIATHFTKVLSIITSNHFLVALEITNLSWGPTPFRFTNLFLKDKEFNKNCKSWWKDTKQSGYPGYSFMRRLIQLKQNICKWAKDKNSKAATEKIQLMKEVDEIDKLEMENCL